MHDAAIYHLVLILHTIDNDGHISRQSAAVQLAVTQSGSGSGWDHAVSPGCSAAFSESPTAPVMTKGDPQDIFFQYLCICRYNHQPQQRSGPILRVAILPPGAAIWQVHRPRRWYWVQEQSRAGIVRGSLNRIVTWNFLAQFWATPPLTSIACEPPGTY